MKILTEIRDLLKEINGKVKQQPFDKNTKDI
jgi:hypothetical protein